MLLFYIDHDELFLSCTATLQHQQTHQLRFKEVQHYICKEDDVENKICWKQGETCHLGVLLVGSSTGELKTIMMLSMKSVLDRLGEELKRPPILYKNLL